MNSTLTCALTVACCASTAACLVASAASLRAFSAASLLISFSAASWADCWILFSQSMSALCVALLCVRVGGQRESVLLCWLLVVML